MHARRSLPLLDTRHSAAAATAAAARPRPRAARVRPYSSNSRSSSDSPSSSSSPSAGARAPLRSGWIARYGVVERSLRRLPRVLAYHDEQLFSPSLSVVHHALLHLALNAPQTLDLDVREFLHGAEVATKRVLEDTNTKEFAMVAAGNASAATSPIATRMALYCAPHCFEQLRQGMQRLVEKKHVVTEALDVLVERVHLTQAGYAQLTEEEYAAELRGVVLDPVDIRSSRRPDNATVERLQLQVEVRTRERVRRTTLHKDVTVMYERNVYLSRFTSRVKTDEELDWRLAAIALRTKGRQVEISRTPILKGAAA